MKRVVLALLCACGDNHPEIEVFEPTNGTRLTIEQYQFDDGTRLVQPTAFYDRRIHARCTPQEWIDGVTRCVPDAEQAFYREDTCTTLFGIGNAIKFATHFLAMNTRDGTRFPERAFAAGSRTDTPIEQGYYRDGEMCLPITIPQLETTTYWELGGEIGGEDLVPISESEVGDGRLGLSVRKSDDGAVVPIGFRDRDLDMACAPVPYGDGAACAPTEATPATYFADNACTQPAIVVADDAVPSVASTLGADGCPSYHAVEETPVARAYVDTGTGCVPLMPTSRVLPLGAPLDLAVVARTVEEAPKRRVQRILASNGDLHVYATRMFDTATRTECELRKDGDTLRCLPTALAPIVRVFQPGCGVELRLAEVPARTCEPYAFAMNDTGESLEIHAIGNAFTRTAYTFGAFGACVPYAASPGASLFEVGPLLPDETFVGAVPFGAR